MLPCPRAGFLCRQFGLQLLGPDTAEPCLIYVAPLIPGLDNARTSLIFSQA